MDPLEKQSCTGCNACYNVCPRDAVRMVPDAEGFLYPFTDLEKCDRCGLCLKKCPALSGLENAHRRLPRVYAAWNKDSMVRLSSTSGGIFSALAAYIIGIDGYVAGARYNEDFTVSHAMIDHLQDIEKLRQSKYVQSAPGLVYREIQKRIDSGKIVLFCGTPCQNAGLIAFLGTQAPNLFLCDFICRGVNSPKVYQKYLEMLEIKYHSQIRQLQFKNKSYGWNCFSTRVEFENGKQYIRDRYSDLYMLGYLEYNLYLRPSCHHCRYKKLPRIADITLGDFWGISNTRPHLDNDEGTSVILLNSSKGDELLNGIRNDIYYEECKLDEVMANNECLHMSAPAGEYREDFFKNLPGAKFDIALKKSLKAISWVKFKSIGFHWLKMSSRLCALWKSRCKVRKSRYRTPRGLI